MAIEMVLEIQCVHVTKHLQGDPAHRPFRHPTEDGVAQFRKENVGEACRAVGQYQSQQ